MELLAQTPLDAIAGQRNQQRDATTKQNLFRALNGGCQARGRRPATEGQATGVITIATVTGATRQLPGTRIKLVHTTTDAIIPSRIDQNDGPRRYKKQSPTTQPTSVLTILDRNATSAALGSGSVTTIMEINAHNGLG